METFRKLLKLCCPPEKGFDGSELRIPEVPVDLSANILSQISQRETISSPIV